MSASKTVNPRALPLEGVVASLSPREDGAVRVTFTRLAAVYRVDPAAPQREQLLLVLERSRDTGEPVRLTWSWPDKSLALL